MLTVQKDVIADLRKAVEEKKIMFPDDPCSNQRIYHFRSTLVAKGDLEWPVKFEYGLSSRLFLNGISVPEPCGIISPVELWGKQESRNKPFWYFLMRYIDGVPPDGKCLSYPELEIAVRCYREEAEKVLALGIIPEDSIYNPCNVLFDRAEQRIYLIDFESWVVDAPPERITYFRQELRKLTLEDWL